MSHKFARGLVVGKFYPLHLGHELLIRRVQDGTRQTEAFQQAQQRWYERELADRGRHFHRVRGPVEARVAQVETMLALRR